MAGMLPGVESARRRRFHHSGGCLDSHSFSTHNSTRRSSFGLYATNNHESFISSSSSLQRNMFYQTYPDESIVGAAKEAKQRLDEKFKAHRKSQNKSENKLNCVEGRRRNQRELHIDGSEKSCIRKFNWTKLSWKAIEEEEECAVCLESLKDGGALIHLSCQHRFHSRCLKPWLDQNSHCPCCRTTIIST